MSHISRIELEIKDLSILKTACRRLGLVFVPHQSTFKWYGEESSCEHAIQVPGARYEIGVIQQERGYQLKCDFYDRSLEKTIGTKGGRLKQAYAVIKAKTEARRKGYSVIEHRTDTAIQLCVRL